MISLERVYETKSRKRKIQQTQIGNHWRVRVPMAAGHSISKITLSFDPSISEMEKWKRLLDYSNLMALCKDCHGKIHAKQQKNSKKVDNF